MKILLDQHRPAQTPKQKHIKKSSAQQTETIKHIDAHLHRNAYKKYRLRNRKRLYHI